MTYLREALCGFIGIDEQRSIVELNEEAARVLERSPADVLGQKLGRLLSTSSRIFFQTQVFPELGIHGRMDELYLSLVKGNGDELPVLMSAGRARAGDPFDYGFYFLPIRRRHLFERELVRVQQAAESSQAKVRAMQEKLSINERLVTLGTLAAGVAHEINNPLTYVAGNLELLEEVLAKLEPIGKAAREELLAMLGDVREGVSRIRAINASLKQLSRADDAERTLVDLRDVVNAALRVAGHTLRYRATVALDICEPYPRVEANEGRLVQVVVNLLVNAAQAMPMRELDENRIMVRAYADADLAHIEVEDNGPGVPDIVKAKIFDPFFTTKPAGEGTGLGLSVCHGIITALGGTIEIRDSKSGGALFCISLQRR